MNALLQIKVSEDIKRKLEQLMKGLVHEFTEKRKIVEIENNGAALLASTPKEQDEAIERFNEKQREFRALGLRITMQNIIRMFLEAGLEKYEHDIPRLLEAVRGRGVTRGRPSGT